MYGEQIGYRTQNSALKNEIVYSNLINIACSPNIFDSLPKETQEKLLSIVNIYINENYEAIMYYRDNSYADYEGHKWTRPNK